MLTLDLGCGVTKHTNSIGIDISLNSDADVISNFEQGLPFADDSFDKVISLSVLEHVGNLDNILKEVKRILKPGGEFEVFVPHFSNPLYYSDPTHIRFFGYFTFDYYSDQSLQKNRWKVPTFYQDEIRVDIEKKEFVFSSRFKYTTKFLRWFSRWVNKTEERSLYYETHLCWMLPAYGIRYHMRFVNN